MNHFNHTNSAIFLHSLLQAVLEASAPCQNLAGHYLSHKSVAANHAHIAVLRQGGSLINQQKRKFNMAPNRRNERESQISKTFGQGHIRITSHKILDLFIS